MQTCTGSKFEETGIVVGQGMTGEKRTLLVNSSTKRSDFCSKQALQKRSGREK